MTQAFRMEEDKMLDVVEKLIGDGDVGGKIDLIDNVSFIILTVRASDKPFTVVNALLRQILVMDTLDPRAEMFEKALKAGQKSTELAQASLLRMKLYVSFL